MNAHQISAFVICLLACAYDLRTRRIPNILTFGAAVLGLGFHAITGGGGAFSASLAGWFAGAALLVPLFWLGGMGAGDVKLLAALGAWLGPKDILWVAFCSAIAGGAIGLLVALVHGYLRQACRNLWDVVGYWLVDGLKPWPELTLQRSRGPRLAYAVPIMTGLMATLWLR